MTKKIAISVPDDVAERLSADDIDNVSAYITEAVRGRMRAEQTRKVLLELGFKITDEGVERMRQRVRALDAQSTPEQRAESWRKFIEKWEKGEE
jgi:hypothetical protein